MGTWGVGPTENDNALDILQPMQSKFVRKAISLLGRYLNTKPATGHQHLVDEGLAYAVAATGVLSSIDTDDGTKLLALIEEVAKTDEGFDDPKKRQAALRKFAKQVRAKIRKPTKMLVYTDGSHANPTPGGRAAYRMAIRQSK